MEKILFNWVKKSHLAVLILGTLLLVFPNVQAQQEIQKITLKQGLEYAINDNYNIKSSDYDVEEATYKTQELKGGFLPQVNIQGAFDNYIKLPTSILPGEIIGKPGEEVAVQMGTTYQYQATAGLKQVLFDPSLFIALKAATNAEELAVLKRKMTKEQIIYEVANMYFDILNTAHQLAHINRLLIHQDSLYKISKAKYTQGVSAKIDVNRIQVEINNLQVQKNNLYATGQQQKNYLKVLTGIPLEQEIELDDKRITYVEIPPYLINSDFYPEMMTNVRVLQQEKSQLILDKKRHQSQYLPTLSMNAQGIYQYQSNILDFTAQNTKFPSALVGLQLNVPIFDSGIRRNKIRQGNVQISRKEEEIEYTQKTLHADYLDAMNKMEVSYKAILTQDNNMELAKEVYKQSAIMYREGMGSLTDLLIALSSFHETNNSYLSEVITYKKACVKALKAKGLLEKLLE